MFAFVRNPLDRLHSSYADKILDVRNAGGTKNIFWNLGITLDMDFETFVERIAEIPDEKIDRHLRAQSSFLCHEGKVVHKNWMTQKGLRSQRTLKVQMG